MKMIKQSILAAGILTAGLVSAQDVSMNNMIKVGATAGLAVPADNLSAAIGVDVAYQYPIAENFKLGVTSGYSHYVGKEGVDGFGIVPVAATGQFTVAQNVFLGADLGYAFFTGKNTEGGAFYYQPKVGYDFGVAEAFLGYKGMSKDGYNMSSINLGAAYKF